MEKKCYCGSINFFELCCKPYLNGSKKAATAEQLMRSRYSAFATQSAEYLVATTHIAQRSIDLKEEVLQWSTSNQWQKLEVIKATKTTVEFKACFLDRNKTPQLHHELSTFIQEQGLWYYVNGTFF
ncbi:MAG: SEC-C motif-containing protein [Flavobacteriales bacterium]|jgi:SEC-C motif-containing protein